MTTEAWPPPPASGDWFTRVFTVLGPDGRHRLELRVRKVQLWGKTVIINVADEVWCDDCWRFLDAEVLGRPGNSHRVGLGGWAGQLLPMGDDDELRGPVEVGF